MKLGPTKLTAQLSVDNILEKKYFETGRRERPVPIPGGCVAPSTFRTDAVRPSCPSTLTPGRRSPCSCRRARIGNTITNWLYALHEANVFGLQYRIFVSVMGLVIVMLSVTGIVIWLRTRGSGR